jgi:hypothetical protein
VGKVVLRGFKDEQELAETLKGLIETVIVENSQLRQQSREHSDAISPLS